MEIFQKFGVLTNCHMPEGKNFAFVHFNTLEEAEQAVAELNGKDLTGAGSKKLVVKYQKEKPKPTPTPKPSPLDFKLSEENISAPVPRKSRFDSPHTGGNRQFRGITVKNFQ